MTEFHIWVKYPKLTCAWDGPNTKTSTWCLPSFTLFKVQKRYKQVSSNHCTCYRTKTVSDPTSLLEALSCFTKLKAPLTSHTQIGLDQHQQQEANQLSWQHILQLSVLGTCMLNNNGPGADLRQKRKAVFNRLTIQAANHQSLHGHLNKGHGFYDFAEKFKSHHF